METYEFEGKTTEEAIENASRHLNLPVEELDIDIIEPGSAGIFGLVGKKAKIKVNVKDEKPSDEENGLSSDEENGLSSDEENGLSSDEENGLSSDEENGLSSDEENGLSSDEENGLSSDEENGLSTDEENGLSTDEENGLSTAKDTLENILERIPVDSTVKAEYIDGKISLNIVGDKSGLLIGRRGKTLDALQFIVNRVVNRTLEKKIRVVVDSENYRQRRIESLTQMALKIGDKAKRIMKPISTNPMNPHDRRIVHLALKEDEKLDTRSRGEGLLKKVVVIPKK
jgi:spoIIIJ-associated protein